jgi:NAD-dependent SIR2 family protein deacetylase
MNQFNRDIKPASHLIHLIASTRNHHPNFVLFLGAGASVESGVKTAGQMIEEWRTQYHKIHGTSLQRDLRKQAWHRKPEEYSTLFELLYDQPSQRREYIENCLEDASPSWGYIYLVELIRQKVFNTVFTTNFDDLLNEACYNYSNEIRPLVCAHDSSIRSVRITTKRPKIIKLHGDFLFDSIKNTVRELESLEANMRDKLKQYSNEFGMIVLGYSGNDRSVMDTLDALLRNDDTFPHGIYWCVMKGSQKPASIDHLSRFPRFHVVEIDGFNAFFADLYASLNPAPHPFFSDPYSVAATNLAGLIQGLGIPTKKDEISAQLAADVSLLGQSIQKQPNLKNIEMPFDVLAWNDLQQKKYDSAAIHVQSGLGQGASEIRVKWALEILGKSWNNTLFDELATAIEASEFTPTFGVSAINVLLHHLLDLDKVDATNQVAQLVRLQERVQRHGGVEHELFCLYQLEAVVRTNVEIPEASREQLNIIADTSISNLNKCGAKVLLKEYSDVVSIIKDVSKGGRLEHIGVMDFLHMPFAKGLPPESVKEIQAFAESCVSQLSENLKEAVGMASVECIVDQIARQIGLERRRFEEQIATSFSANRTL